MTNEDRQTVTQREAFEAWMVEHGGRGGMEQSVSNPGNYMSGVIQLAWIAWQAATLAERERCAKICDVTPPQPFRPSIEAAWAIRKG